ncbi:hypothetical protein [Sphingomonas sp. PWP1-2]|uniref:hypothetical protein n=1 Tax=Sphingomonas sp. PWP1-2 TaxID=2804558 RepID=UPI003CF9D014
MGNEKFSIEIDAARRLLRLRLIGFWSNDDVVAFATAEQLAVAKLAGKTGEHLVLADLSEFKLQSQEVVKSCQSFIASARLSSKRLALVGGEGLAWIQIKRVMVRDRMQAFMNIADAEEWLFSNSECDTPKLARSFGTPSRAGF